MKTTLSILSKTTALIRNADVTLMLGTAVQPPIQVSAMAVQRLCVEQLGGLAAYFRQYAQRLGAHPVKSPTVFTPSISSLESILGADDIKNPLIGEDLKSQQTDLASYARLVSIGRKRPYVLIAGRGVYIEARPCTWLRPSDSHYFVINTWDSGHPLADQVTAALIKRDAESMNLVSDHERKVRSGEHVLPSEIMRITIWAPFLPFVPNIAFDAFFTQARLPLHFKTELFRSSHDRTTLTDSHINEEFHI